MEFETLKEVLMNPNYDHQMTSEKADASIQKARERLMGYVDEGDEESAYNICQEMWGIEPDWVMELM